MSDVTRLLCQKYTSLSDVEISCIESYEPKLQPLANAEQADVFIDCRTATGRTAIVVCEAKPQTVPSSYTIPILGMLIQWRNEPAVDRSFRLGVPTTDVKAESMPEDRQIVQSVEPIYCAGKLIAVLILEKRAERFSLPPEGGVPPVDSLSAGGWFPLLNSLSDAVILLDERDRVCAFNTVAARLYRSLGFVSPLKNMRLGDLLLDDPQSLPAEFTEVLFGTHVLQYRFSAVSEPGIRGALILRDMTALRRKEQESLLQSVALRELRHRMKNDLRMLSDLLLRTGGRVTDADSARASIVDTAGRLLALTTTLDGDGGAEDGKRSLRSVVEQVRSFTLQTLLAPTQDIVITVSGDDLAVSPDCASTVSLVVSELLQNAVRHAFPAGGRGEVEVRIERTALSCRITVSDNGAGFDPDKVEGEHLGLELVRSLVSDKLVGELSIRSGSSGTSVSFDFLE